MFNFIDIIDRIRTKRFSSQVRICPHNSLTLPTVSTIFPKNVYPTETFPASLPCSRYYFASKLTPASELSPLSYPVELLISDLSTCSFLPPLLMPVLPSPQAKILQKNSTSIAQCSCRHLHSAVPTHKFLQLTGLSLCHFSTQTTKAKALFQT